MITDPLDTKAFENYTLDEKRRRLHFHSASVQLSETKEKVLTFAKRVVDARRMSMVYGTSLNVVVELESLTDAVGRLIHAEQGFLNARTLKVDRDTPPHMPGES